MADISQYLQAIMAAVYGEDVRGSIHDAIALINDVGETVLTLGTAVDSPTSPTTGFYQDSVYLNTSTGDMWTCTGTGWSLSGNTKGDQGDPGLAATIDVGTVTSGAVASVTNSGTTSAAVFDFVLPQGDKGETGDGLTAESAHMGSNTVVTIKNSTTQAVVDTFNVPDGAPGATGNGIASIAKTATAGLVDTYTITYTDGTSTTFTVTNGQDGSGAGDMTKSAYDPTNTVADAGGIPAYVSAHAGTTYTGEKGVTVAGTVIKAALVNDSASLLASETISVSADRQYAVGLDANDHLSVNVPWTDTTYNDATTATSGLMSATDKTKLNGLSEVVANPAGSSTADLTKLQIGNTIYAIKGGGGTTIVQIPSVSGTSFVYTGTAQGAAITGLDNTHCTVVPGTGTTVTTVGTTTYVQATNAGSYDFTIELNDPSSMVWSDLTNADLEYSFTIAKAPQTITASKNSVSLTAQQPSDTVTISGQQGSLNVSSSDTGVATVSESSGVVTITGTGTGSATVSVYAEETANYAQSATISINVAAAMVPNGKTVTPTDVIQTWLNCADIWDKTYTTINEVLADSTTLLALISSNNAADYMARSTTWASAVTANSTAMTLIGANDYCADALLNNSTWSTAICNSTYFESVLNVKVPTMTSDTTPTGVGTVSESSAATNDRKGFKIFDGVKNANNYWQTIGNATNEVDWVQFTFTAPVSINKLDISAYKDASTSNTQYFKLMASNDNFVSDSHIIMNETSATVSTDLAEVSFNFANSDKYTSYRLYQWYDTKYYSTDLYYSLIHESQFYGRA